MRTLVLRILLPAFLLAAPLTAQVRADTTMSCMGAGAGMGQGGGMMMDHQAMMRMEAMDARLDSLVKVMRSARGDRRLNAMAEILGELADRQLAMRREMHQRMMQQEHGSGMSGGGTGMRDCAMMRPDSTAAAGHQMNH